MPTTAQQSQPIAPAARNFNHLKSHTQNILFWLFFPLSPIQCRAPSISLPNAEEHVCRHSKLQVLTPTAEMKHMTKHQRQRSEPAKLISLQLPASFSGQCSEKEIVWPAWEQHLESVHPWIIQEWMAPQNWRFTYQLRGKTCSFCSSEDCRILRTIAYSSSTYSICSVAFIGSHSYALFRTKPKWIRTNCA